MKKHILFILAFGLSIGFFNNCSKSKRRQEIQNNVVVNPTNKDNIGPVIVLTKPQIISRGLVVVPVESTILVEGKATDESGVSTILVNNQTVNFANDGTFTTTISRPSNNEIRVKATDTKGNSKEETFIISDKNNPTPIIDNQKRFALIIGNADYLIAQKLRNPVNDADAIANSLRNLGFTVFKYENLSQSDLKQKIDEFGDQLISGCVSLFYYAGHGLQVNGINYLIPTDAKPTQEQDVEYQCVEVGRVLAKMESAGSIVNIMILDACRDNPFSQSWTRGSEIKGLAPMNAPAGSIIAFAADANQSALDGSGNHGLFTEELLTNISKPNMTIQDVLLETRNAVIQKSGKKQVPSEYSNLTVRFYFNQQ